MNVKEKFIELTKQTYPHGVEIEVSKFLPNFLKQDQFGNLYHQIGDKPTTMFTSHLDTASYDSVEVNHLIKGDMIYSDGTSILGADDKAGVVVLLTLIEKNVPGLYYFFVGEERGCVGSRKVANLHKDNPIEGVNKVVSFDRRGYDSVITHQLSGRSCSFNFASDLSNELNNKSKIFDKPFKYLPDSTGIYTDSAQFIDIYPECTNISVGYQNEHTKYEQQDIKHLEKLCEVVCKIDWDNLKVYRDITKNNYYDLDDDFDYGTGYSYSDRIYKSYSDESLGSDLPTEVKTTVLDTEYYGHETLVKYNYNTFEIIEVKPHVARLANEKSRIDKLLTDLEIDYDEIHWDGNNLVIKNLNDKDIILKRKEISEYISSLNDWIETEIKYNSIS